jgi:hypothetical protein
LWELLEYQRTLAWTAKMESSRVGVVVALAQFNTLDGRLTQMT